MASDVYVRLLFSICLLFSVILSAGSDEALYSSADHLSILSANKFYHVLPRTEHAWFVEFYSSWCGHCIRFAPQWRQLANEVRAWKPVIQLAVIDCAQEENLKLCRDYNVESYPTLKWIDAHSAKGERGVTYEGLRGTNDLKHAMIEHLQNITGSPSAPKLTPKLTALRSLEDIWNDVTDATRFTVVVFEESHSYIGREVALDFAFRTDLVLRRMTKEGVSKFGVHSFPSLFLIGKQGTFEKIAENTDRHGFIKSLNKLLGIDEETQYRDSVGGKDHANTSHSRLASNNYVYMQDILSGIHYSLKQEIAGHKEIVGEKLDALKSFMIVLSKYFPGDKSVLAYLNRISTWLEKENYPLRGDIWLKQINILEEEKGVLGTGVEWRGCQGSIPKYRGYPCSLWILFHTLTVNSVLDAGDGPRFNHLEVLRAMRGYIKTFFGCRECSKHFMKMAVSIEEEVLSPEDSILWLWRAHNKANRRLHGDLTEDPAHPKFQFPPPSLCQQCYKQHQDGDPTFDEEKVLIFLKQHYSQANILHRSDKEAPSLSGSNSSDTLSIRRRNDFNDFASKKGQRQSDKMRSQSQNIEDTDRRIRRLRSAELESRSHAIVLTHWGLNSIDISLCVLFYIVCCGIIILVYWHLNHNHHISIKHLTRSVC